jgi:hypothetical protein
MFNLSQEQPSAGRAARSSLAASSDGQAARPTVSNVPRSPFSPARACVFEPEVGAPSTDSFVNTSRGTSPGSLQHGVIPDELEAFKHVVTKPLTDTILPTPPPR